MKSLHEVRFLRFVEIQVLTIYCLVHLIDSLNLKSTNGQEKFEVGSQATFTCTILPYTGTLNWYYTGTKVAGCTGTTCTDIDNDQGAFKFQYDIISFIFIWIIPSVQTKYDGMSFTCSDGTNNQSITITVKEKKNDETNQELLWLCILIIIPISVLVCICICISWKRCFFYNANCCPVNGVMSISMSVKPVDYSTAEITWDNKFFDGDTEHCVIRVLEPIPSTKYKNERGRILDKDDFKNLKYSFDGLACNTQYQFIMTVEKYATNTIASSICMEMKTFDTIKLTGETKSTSKCVLWWNCKHFPGKSKLLLEGINESDENSTVNETPGNRDPQNIVESRIIAPNETQNGTWIVSKLKPNTRYLFFIKMLNVKGKTIAKSNRINITTLDMELKFLQSDIRNGTARFEVTSSCSQINTNTYCMAVNDTVSTKRMSPNMLNENMFDISVSISNESLRFWMESNDSKPSNITAIGEQEETIDLLLERRETTEARFYVVPKPHLNSSVTYKLMYGASNKDCFSQSIQNINTCQVITLEERVKYIFFVVATEQDKTYFSNIIRDETLGRIV